MAARTSAFADTLDNIDGFDVEPTDIELHELDLDGLSSDLDRWDEDDTLEDDRNYLYGLLR